MLNKTIDEKVQSVECIVSFIFSIIITVVIKSIVPKLGFQNV